MPGPENHPPPSARTVVVGAGGIGGTVAASLARAGHAVTVVEPWEDHVAAIRENGLRVQTPGGGFRVELDALLPGEVDRLDGRIGMLVISVKAYDTIEAYETVRSRLDADATIVCAQNGITEEVIARLTPPGHVIGCSVTLAAEFSEPGVVIRTCPEDWMVFTIGEMDGRMTPRVEAAAAVLEAAGSVTRTDDVAGALWSKLARNAMTNGLSALTGGTTGTMWGDDDYLPFVVQAAAESAAVARAAGVTLHPIAGRIPADLLLRGLEGDARAVTETKTRLRAFAFERTKDGDHLPSMLQDARKGRRTEIDHLNGHVSMRGRELGVPTPLNDRIVEAVHALERGDLTIDPGNLDLLREALLPGDVTGG